MIIFVTMNNIYYRDIIELLLPQGKGGLKLSIIAKRVYNLHADLFDDSIKYEEIYKEVGLFLWKQSQKRESPFRHNAYGIYSIKPDMAVQLDLFWDLPTDKEEDDGKEDAAAVNDINKCIQMELFS